MRAPERLSCDTSTALSIIAIFAPDATGGRPCGSSEAQEGLPSDLSTIVLDDPAVVATERDSYVARETPIVMATPVLINSASAALTDRLALLEQQNERQQAEIEQLKEMLRQSLANR